MHLIEQDNLVTWPISVNSFIFRNVQLPVLQNKRMGSNEQDI